MNTLANRPCQVMNVFVTRYCSKNGGSSQFSPEAIQMKVRSQTGRRFRLQTRSEFRRNSSSILVRRLGLRSGRPLSASASARFDWESASARFDWESASARFDWESASARFDWPVRRGAGRDPY